jgi:cell division protein FtsI/penicillin-binding protein 2
LPGRARLSVDSRRSTLAQTTVRDAQPGQDMGLTLDIAAQRAPEQSRRPLTNRAVSAYPPASTFSSLTLLDGGYLTPETWLACSPSFPFGGTLMRNWSPEDRCDYTVTQARPTRATRFSDTRRRYPG